MSTATPERTTGLDEAAFSDLWAQHDAVVGYMRRHVPDIDAEDLADETFTRAWAGRHTFRASAGTPTGWLWGIASRVMADHYRTAGRRVHTVAAWPNHDNADGTDVAADTVADAAVAELLATLPERQRLVVARRILDDQPIAAVAAELGCPEGTVKSLASRALSALRTLLAPVTAVEVQPAAATVNPVVAPTVSPALVAKHLSPLPLPALARQHIPSLDQPRSINVPINGRPHRRRRRVVPARGVDRRGLGHRPPTAPRAGTPTRPGNLRRRHCGRPLESGNPGVEATGPPGGNPRRLGAAQQRPVGPGTPHGTGRAGTAAAGTLMSGMAVAAGLAVVGAAASAFAALGSLVRGSARGRRDTDHALAVVDRRRDMQERVWLRWNTSPTQPAIGTATPDVPALKLEHTVRLTQPWPQPIPQTVLDHMRLQDDRQANNTGRHWRATP